MVDTQAKIREIIAEQLGIAEDDISAGSSFMEDLGADSLDLVELVMAMEEEFEIDIPDEEAERLETVQELIEYIAAKTS
ncbi:MAG: acyl carrier protein [Deltaproteobacteria bacterium]|nr:acyl carrier protein [Deltaproteobacteria bacterium]